MKQFELGQIDYRFFQPVYTNGDQGEDGRGGARHILMLCGRIAVVLPPL